MKKPTDNISRAARRTKVVAGNISRAARTTVADEGSGMGHRGRCCISIKGTFVDNGQTNSFDYNIEAIVSMENIEYAVKAIAGTVAQVASKIAAEPTAS